MNGDPMAYVHKVWMANSLAAGAVMGAGGATLAGSIILEERLDYYSQKGENQESLTFRDAQPL